jgi:hypothetical protein
MFHAGEHEVEHDQGVLAGLSAFQSANTIVDRFDDELILFEAFGQHLA